MIQSWYELYIARLMIRVFVPLFFFSIAVVIAAFTLPALVASVAAHFVIRKRYPNYLQLMRLHHEMRTSAGLKKIAVTLLVGALCGYGVYFVVNGLSILAAGTLVAGALQTLAAGAVAVSGGYMLYRIYRGEFMSNIFST